jgi:hypothetical protein
VEGEKRRARLDLNEILFTQRREGTNVLKWGRTGGSRRWKMDWDLMRKGKGKTKQRMYSHNERD